MDDILNFIVALCSAILGFLTGVLLLTLYMRAAYIKPMDALGIEKFQKHEINTTYEIIYKKETK